MPLADGSAEIPSELVFRILDTLRLLNVAVYIDTPEESEKLFGFRRHKWPESYKEDFVAGASDLHTRLLEVLVKAEQESQP